MIMNSDNEGRGVTWLWEGPSHWPQACRPGGRRGSQRGEAECLAWSSRWRRDSVLVASVEESFFFIELG